MKEGNKTENRISIEMAPMEGITTATFRRVYAKWFAGVDRMYTPFLAANQTHKFKTREKKETEQYSPDLVPQILTDKAEHFIWAAKELKMFGYTEVNLNAGCPSATVTTKKKGAGLLADPFLPERISSREKEIVHGFSDREKEIVHGFLTELYDEYERDLSEGTALLKMKDLWNFMAASFPGQEKKMKAIRKARSGWEYKAAVKSLL